MKPEKDFERIQDAIVEASREVFRRYGYVKVTMQDISKASGKGRSTLYHYFKNKDEVLEAFAERELSTLLHVVQALLRPEESFTNNLHVFYKAKLQGFKQLLIKYNTLIADIKLNPVLFVQKHKLFLKEEADIIAKVIGWAVDSGEIGKMKESDVVFLSETITTAFRSFEMDFLLFGGMGNLEKRLGWMCNILFKGIR